MRPVCNRLPLAQALEKAGLKAIDRDRASVVKLRKAMAETVAAFLAKVGPGIADQLAELLGLVEKASKPGGNHEALAEAAVRARKALDALEFGEEWHGLITVEDQLAAMATDGALAGLKQIGATADDIVTIAGDQAAAWGRARAAEMVGMKRNAAGDLVPNPKAKWRIDESTREMVRSTVETALTEGQSADELKAALLDGHAFSPERAEMIARTEMAKADMAGTMVGYRTSGLVMGKKWSTSQDDLVSQECVACEAAGAIGLDDTFPSGEDAPPNHPNCRCTVLPVLDDEIPVLLGGKNLKDTNMTKLYAAIEKAEKQDDGTIKVFGFASSEVVDSDGETVTADAMKAAREGYMAWGAVREMHDAKKAAGVAIEYEVQDDGRTWFGAHVVDPVAVLKVETGVYKGFSIGAKVPKGGREGNLIKSIDLREISLVDRPANPEAVFTLCKADGGADEADTEGGATDLKKGLYELRDFADVLRSIGYLAGIAEWETQSEGDKSPLPAALRDWLAQGVAIFKAMAEEETAELLAGLKAMVPQAVVVDAIAAADTGGDLTKAGKRFSKSTKAALAKIHGACKEASAHLDGLGYDAEDDDETEGDAGKADDAADLQKRAAAEADQVTEVAKAAGLDLPEQTVSELAKAALTELLTLRKAHADLLGRPASAKGVLNTVAISKAADRTGTDDKEPAPVTKADGAVDDVATLIKSAQSRPIRFT